MEKIKDPTLRKLLTDTEESLPLYLYGLFDLKDQWSTMYFVGHQNNYYFRWVRDVDTGEVYRVTKYHKPPKNGSKLYDKDNTNDKKDSQYGR